MNCCTSSRDRDRDRISELPDEILGKILSLVPTKVAVSTSVLSKRWRMNNNDMMVHVDTLSFDESVVVYPNEEEAENGKDRFLEFLDRTLRNCQIKKIKKLSLSHRGGRFTRSPAVYGWIWSALEGGLLEELHLECTRNEVDLERKLFTSNTLVKLTLSREYCLTVDRVFLPALKSLSLLTVGGVDYDNYRRLIKGCPVLEELLITDITAHALDPYPPCATASVKSPSIKRLVISLDMPYGSPHKHSFEDFYNQCHLKAPSLVYLDYSSHVFADYRFVHLDSLLHVRLNLKLWDHHKHFLSDLTKLASGISNITTLHLSPDSLEAFHFCCKSMPVFKNLLNLSIESNKNKGWQVMPLLLNRCPNLHTLIFKGLVHRVTDKCGDACACTPNNKHNNKKKKKVISCLRTCQVKVLEIGDYGGSFQELKLMRHFLGKLECLETVRVGIEADRSMFLRANLLTLPILSSNCNNIHFI